MQLTILFDMHRIFILYFILLLLAYLIIFMIIFIDNINYTIRFLKRNTLFIF